MSSLGLRLVTLRLGVVLDRGGGALARMVPLFQLFVGGPPGDGKQWLSWVSREDTVRAFVRAIDDESLSGAYNVTAPQPVRMAELCSELGAATGRPSWLPVPEVAVSLLLGEGGASLRPKNGAADSSRRCEHSFLPVTLLSQPWSCSRGSTPPPRDSPKPGSISNTRRWPTR